MPTRTWPSIAAELCDRNGDVALAAVIRRADADPASRRLLLHDSRVQRVLTTTLAAGPEPVPTDPPVRAAAERAELMRRQCLGPQLDALRATWLSVAALPDPTLGALAVAVLAANPEAAVSPAETPVGGDDDQDDGGWMRR